MANHGPAGHHYGAPPGHPHMASMVPGGGNMAPYAYDPYGGGAAAGGGGAPYLSMAMPASPRGGGMEQYGYMPRGERRAVLHCAAGTGAAFAPGAKACLQLAGRMALFACVWGRAGRGCPPLRPCWALASAGGGHLQQCCKPTPT